MPKDPYIREKYTKERTAARRLVAEYLQRFPKDRERLGQYRVALVISHN
jgi:hypothetical protein